MSVHLSIYPLPLRLAACLLSVSLPLPSGYLLAYPPVYLTTSIHQVSIDLSVYLATYLSAC